MKSARSVLFAAIGLSMLMAGPVFAQAEYPTKAITVIVPYAPGGATDTTARILSEKVEKTLDQSIVIENKPGSFGILAIELMANAEPDGYTLMLGNVTTNAITPVLFPEKMSINYDEDVVAIARLVLAPNLFVATDVNFEPRTMDEFIEYAKANPGKVRYGSAGVASFPHFDTALLAKRAGLEMIHIPFAGGAGDLQKDLLNGDIQVALLNAGTARGLIEAGQIHPLATVLEERLENYPDVPTLAEVGFPDMGTVNWQGLFAPAGTPPEVIAKLNEAFTEALTDPAVLGRFKKVSSDVFPPTSPEDTRKWLQDEMAKWRSVVEETDIELPK